MNTLTPRFEKAMRESRLRFSPFDGDSRVWIGFETRRGSDRYLWDGLERDADAARPEIVFQATLSGSGKICAGGATFSVGEGQAFLARIPSPDTYYLPQHSPPWTFFWMIVEHPFVVQRLWKMAEARGPLLELEKHSALVEACTALWFGTISAGWSDRQAQEMALLKWMLELERSGSPQADSASTVLLDWLTATVRRHLPKAISVEELAALRAMTRSHFSHWFRKTTGRSPATVMREVRLETALALLPDPTRSIDDVASLSGHSSTHHFIKAFKARWGVSPGRFRKSRLGSR